MEKLKQKKTKGKEEFFFEATAWRTTFRIITSKTEKQAMSHTNGFEHYRKMMKTMLIQGNTKNDEGVENREAHSIGLIDEEIVSQTANAEMLGEIDTEAEL